MDQLRTPSWPPPTSSSPSLSSASAKAAKFLLSCYRPGDVNDPDVYFQAVTSLLGSYPEDVILAVVDPRSGLPSRLKWLPTIAEVKEACEREMAPIYRQRRWDREADERRKLLEEPADRERPTFDELKAKHGDNWGICQGDDERKRHTYPSLEQMCADAGVTVEEFEDIHEEATQWQKLRFKP